MSAKTIKEAGFAASRSSLHGDHDFFQNLGVPVALREGEFVLSQPDLRSTKRFREEAARESKQVIGELGAAMVWGAPATRQASDTGSVISTQDIERQLESISKSRESSRLVAVKAEEVHNKLGRLWKKSHRLACVDAGTTTECVARAVERIRTPDPSARLSGLRVLTNSPSIAAMLGDPSVSTEIISLGGQLRKDTEATTGELARRCLEAWALNTDIAIVGTTSIDLNEQCFRCDSEDEAVTKSLLIAHANIRCVVADSSKFGRGMVSSFPFALVTREAVDVVITDRNVTQTDSKKLGELGVVVLKPPN